MKSNFSGGGSDLEWTSVSSRSRKIVFRVRESKGGRALTSSKARTLQAEARLSVATATVSSLSLGNFLRILKPFLRRLLFGVVIWASLEKIRTRRRRQEWRDLLMDASTEEEAGAVELATQPLTGDFLGRRWARLPLRRQSLMDLVGVLFTILDTIIASMATL